MSDIPEIRTILYATDLGSRTRPVFRQAVALARRCGAKIIMLHVVEPLGATGRAVLSVYLPQKRLEDIEKESLKEVIGRMKARLAKFCEDEAGLCEGDSALVSEIVVAAGRAGEEIARQAGLCGADLVVVGSCTHAMGGGLLGSTARRVTQEARVPVLVVPNC